jgi:hypothetical protein
MVFPFYRDVCALTRASRATREAFRDRHERRSRDAMDALAATDERGWSGRRKRVVLPPTLGSSRRGCLRITPMTVARKARTPGRARHKPKTIARGAPACSAVPVVSNSCAFYPCTRGYGCGQHPVLPAPSLAGRPNDWAKLGRVGAARSRFAARLMSGAASGLEGPGLEGLGLSWIARKRSWLGNLDSNQDKQSQSLLCYRYTIPQRISEQSQCLRQILGG